MMTFEFPHNEQDPGQARYAALFNAWYDAMDSAIALEKNGEDVAFAVKQCNAALKQTADFIIERARTMGGRAFTTLEFCEEIPIERRATLKQFQRYVFAQILESMKVG